MLCSGVCAVKSLCHTSCRSGTHFQGVNQISEVLDFFFVTPLPKYKCCELVQCKNHPLIAPGETLTDPAHFFNARKHCMISVQHVCWENNNECSHSHWKHALQTWLNCMTTRSSEKAAKQRYWQLQNRMIWIQETYLYLWDEHSIHKKGHTDCHCLDQLVHYHVLHNSTQAITYFHA